MLLQFCFVEIKMSSTTKDSTLPHSQWELSQCSHNGSLELGQFLHKETSETWSQNLSESQASGFIKRIFVVENAVFTCTASTITILEYLIWWL